MTSPLADPLKTESESETKKPEREYHPYNCTNCAFGSDDAKTVLDHIRSEHLSLRQNSCPAAGCSFTTCSKTLVVTHLKTVHLGVKTKVCPECGHKVRDKFLLDRHVASKHPEKSGGEKVFECDKCDFRSNRKEGVKMHDRQVHQMLRPHKCRWCEFEAFKPSKLKRHVDAVHLKALARQCKECGKVLAGSDSLRNHLKIVHYKIKRHQCGECDFRAVNLSSLRVHAERSHEIKTEVSTE